MTGLIAITPSSVSFTGTSATILSSGAIECNALTVLTCEDVFSATYTNYLMTMTYTIASGDPRMCARLRVGGSDASTNYTRQFLDVTTSTSAARASETFATIGEASVDLPNGEQVFIYRPYEALSTGFRNINIGGKGSARLTDNGCGHSTATSYTGLTIYPISSSFSGVVAFFGYEE